MLWQTNDNPDIRGHLIFSKSYFGQECNEVLKNKIDFCIMGLPVNYTKTAYEIFLKERILLAGNNSHPLVEEINSNLDLKEGYPHMDLSKLDNEILFLPGQNFSELIQYQFSKGNFQPGHVKKIQNITTALKLVMQGMGFTFLPESGINTTVYHRDITLFTVGEPEFSWSLAVAYKKKTEISHSIRLFIESLKEIYSD